MTTTAPTPTGRQLPVEQVIRRYRDRLANAEERAIVAEATAEAAEDECAQLRLRVIELEQQVTPEG